MFEISGKSKSHDPIGMFFHELKCLLFVRLPKTWVEAIRSHKLSSLFLLTSNIIIFLLFFIFTGWQGEAQQNCRLIPKTHSAKRQGTQNTHSIRAKQKKMRKESWITFFKCLLTHFVKVFFWIASRSSVERERIWRNEKKKEKLH